MIHQKDPQESEKLVFSQLRFITGKRTQSKIRKRKEHTGPSPGKSSISCRVSSPSEVAGTCLILPVAVCDSTRSVSSTGKLTQDLESRVFIGSQSYRHSTQVTDSSSLEQKQVFTRNHTVGINHLITLVPCGSRHIKTLLSGIVFQELRPQLPEAGQGLLGRQAEETGLSWECAGFEQPRPAPLTVSCTVL